MCIRSIRSRPAKVSMRSCYIFVSPKRENRSHLQMDHLIEKYTGVEEFVCLRYFQIEHFPFSEKEQAHNHHVALLEHHKTKQDPHLGIAEGQTKSQCTVCQFVRIGSSALPKFVIMLNFLRSSHQTDPWDWRGGQHLRPNGTLLLPDRGNRIPEWGGAENIPSGSE